MQRTAVARDRTCQHQRPELLRRAHARVIARWLRMSIMLQPQRAGAPPRASRAAWPRQRRAGALSGARRSRALASAAREAPPLPQSCQAAISAAAAASAEALAAGRVRQTVELLLPVYVARMTCS